jgi:hypothetical protein
MAADFAQLKESFERAHQAHVFADWDTLSAQQREELLQEVRVSSASFGRCGVLGLSLTSSP